MSESQVLLKTQKNEIFEILRGAGLEPADFSWSEEESLISEDLIVSRLKYRDGRFYYQFDFSERTEAHWYECSPGQGIAVQSEYTATWAQQLYQTNTWANLLKSEIDAPDLWQEIEKYRATFSLAPPEKLLNEPIPAYEAEKIGDSLRVLAEDMKKHFELTQQQNEFVRSKLDYLVEAAKRQGRLDWVHTCIGVLITIAMGLAMSPEEASKLWEFARNLLGQFIRLIGP